VRQVREDRASGFIFIGLHQGLQFRVGHFSGLTPPSGSSGFIHAGLHRTGKTGGSIRREFHPNTLTELIVMDYLRGDHKGFPGTLISRIWIGNADLSSSLMTPDELKTLPKGHFILAKTGCCPMQTRLPLFLKWGIRFEEPYEVEEQAARPVHYADRFELEQEILRRRDDFDEEEEWDEPPALPVRGSGGLQHTPAKEPGTHHAPRRLPLRTD
ncbi:MAG: hypothetical protein ACI4D9_05695, partial [Lachnospiraceae bacterium]